MAQVEVVALERGHDGSRVIEADEKFYVSDARLVDGSTWFVAVNSEDQKRADQVKATRAKRESKQPPGAGPVKGSTVGDGGKPAENQSGVQQLA